MPRILLLLVLVWILYVVIKRFVRSVNHMQSNAKEKKADSIVACSKCGLHVPQDETRMINNQVYCNNPNCYKDT